jgi:hypothetical protein
MRRRTKHNAVAPIGDAEEDIEAKFDISLEWGKIIQGDHTDSPGTKQFDGAAASKAADTDSNAKQQQPQPVRHMRSSDDTDADALSNAERHQALDSPRAGEVRARRISVTPAAHSGGEMGHDELVALSAEMRELFAEIKKEIVEYKDKHHTLASAVKGADVSRADLETRMEEMEEENAQLQLALTKGLENRNSSPAKHEGGGQRGRRDSSAGPDLLAGGGGGGASNDIRRVLLDQDDTQVLEEAAGGVENVFILRHKFARWVVRHTPFEQENRRLHAMFGGAVAAYFLFLRWLFMNFLFIGAIAAAISVIHITNMLWDNRGAHVLTGGNVLPGFMLISTFAPYERVLYATTVIVMIIVLCFIGLMKLISEDVNKKRYEIKESGKEAVYSKLLLVGWDNALVTATEAAHHTGSLAGMARELLAATRCKGEQQSRTRLATAILVLRRLLGFTLYGAMQFGCYVLIAYLTVESSNIQDKANSVGFLKFFAPSIVPAVVTGINSATPAVITVITLFERWDSGQTEVNLRILRMFISRILNILVLAMAYGFLANPFLFADTDSESIRRKVEIGFSDGFTCRLNQTGDGMTSLVFTDLVISMLVLLGIGVGSKLLARVTGDPWVKLEFDTASTMVSVLYFAGLVVLTMPYSPLSLIFAPLMLALRFKWEAWVSATYSSKPQKPWQAHAAGRTFTIFYLITLVFIGLSSAFFFLGVDTFAKSCDIQDANVKLCLGAVDPDTDLCTLDESNKYYALYSDTSYCVGGYPYCVCHGDLACGPFIDDEIALNPFAKRINEIYVVGFIWQNFIENSYGTWLLVGILVLMVNFRYNSFRVTKTAKKEKEAQYLAHIGSLQAEQKRQYKIINRLRILEGQGGPGDKQS